MAYGKSGRQGVHRDGMHQHGFWCEDAEWEGFKAVAERFGLSPANMVKAIGNGELEVAHVLPKQGNRGTPAEANDM